MSDFLVAMAFGAFLALSGGLAYAVLHWLYYFAARRRAYSRHLARSRAKASIPVPPDWPNYDHIARLEQWHQQYEAGGIKSAEVIETWDHRGPYLLERTPPPYDPDGPVVHHPEDERLVLGPNGWQWAD